MQTHLDHQAELIELLQLAYSGELAAAYAYRGHWRSVSDPEEKSRIKTIEEEEWHHRKLVGEMLNSLGSGPNNYREFRAAILGRVLGFLCHVSGWFAPMYGAGKLESRNIVEYEIAARQARNCGRHEFVDCLLKMAEVEWEHEYYFRERISDHSFCRFLRVWAIPPEKENIRRSFEKEVNPQISEITPIKQMEF